VKCVYSECLTVDQRNLITNHEKQCKHGMTKCEYCGESSTVTTIEEHYQQCCEIPIECECQESVKKENLSYHKETSCLEEMITCDKKCGKILKRRDIESHKRYYYCQC